MNRRQFLKRSAAAVVALRSSRSLSTAAEPICLITIDRLESSTSSFAGLGFLEALEAARRIRFAGIEILTFTNGKHSVGQLPGTVVAALSPEDRDRALKSVRQFRHITTHLPFYNVYMASKNEEVRNASLAQLHAAIDDSAFWGASVATLHAALEPGQTYDESFLSLISSLRELGAHAKLVRLRLGVEVGWPNNVEQYLGLIREVDHLAVGGTIDTGHVTGYTKDLGISDAQRALPIGAERYNEVLLNIVDGLGPKLFHFHVDDVNSRLWSDYRPLRTVHTLGRVPPDHHTLGTGIVDWRGLITRLSSNSYSGLFALELEEPCVVAAAKQSRNFFKKVLSEANQKCS